MTILLTTTQLEKINEFVIPSSLNNFKPNYAGMYQYIFEQVGGQMPDNQKYWFQQAAEINAYLNAVAIGDTSVLAKPSSYFIQQINKLSLEIRANPNFPATDANVALISNTIGEKIYHDIIQHEGLIPELSSQVENDINVTIEVADLNLNQWGGAFYFWDTVLPDATSKIGDIIVDAGNVDQFVDMTGTAMARTIDKFGFTGGEGGGDATWNAIKGAIQTFSYGYSGSSLKTVVWQPLLIQGPEVVMEITDVSDQGVGFEVLLKVVKEWAIINLNTAQNFADVTYDDFKSYFKEVSENLTASTIDEAISHLFK